MEFLTFPELATGFIDLQTDMHENPEAHRGYRTHIPEINKILGGLGRKWYVVIGGPEKSGKTAFVISLLTQFGKQEMNILNITLEMDNMQVGARMFSNVSGVSMTKFRDVNLTGTDFDELHIAKGEIEMYTGGSAYGVFQVEQVAAMVHQYKPQVVFIDYVQLMSTQERKGTRREELEYISRTLKQLTINPGCLVVAMVQMNQQNAKAKNYNVSTGFHGSATFKNDADVALTIAPHFDENDIEQPEFRDCHIVASRHSYKDSFQLAFFGSRSLMAGSTADMELIGAMTEDVYRSGESLEWQS